MEEYGDNRGLHRVDRRQRQMSIRASTLPTGGSGKSFSGLRADQFQRRASIVRMDQKALKKSLPTVETFARVEGLDAHGKSVSIRVE